MGFAVRFYKVFKDLGEERAALLAEFAEYVETRKAATSEELGETELRLQAQIEGTRLEVEKVRKEMREAELRLQKEIEGVKAEVARTKADLVKWMFLFWTGQVVALIGILKWLF